MKEIKLMDYLQMIRDEKVHWTTIWDYCDEHDLEWVEMQDGWLIDDVYVCTEWLNGSDEVYMDGQKKGE